MTTHTAKRIVFAIALVAFAGTSLAAGARGAFSDNGRSVSDPRDPYAGRTFTVAGLERNGVSASPARSFDSYTDGARSVQEPRDPYTDGAAKFSPGDDGARSPTGMNLTDALLPAHNITPLPTAPSRNAPSRQSHKQR